MKSFPRLHSLHTLSIRHHQSFNYKLHGLRTDFIGESGSGKSIVADLLQLIFVGPREYRSATQSLEDKREPKTLLIPGESLGYAFLNIETDEGEYVVIGVQVEDVHHGVRLFIIQQGFELDEQSRLNPFFEPMEVADILDGEEVLSVAELATHLEPRGYLLKQFPSTKAYHALLYRSELLPIDLASSEQAVKTYAKIIQAFSRRKSLDPKKSKELVEFLFGSDKGQEHYRQYESLMKAVARDDDDYELNRTEVERIKEKETALLSLRAGQRNFLETRRIYHLALLQDAFDQRRLAKQRLFTAFERYHLSTKTMTHWRNYCQQQYESFTKQQEPLVKAETEALATYTKKSQPFERVQRVGQWLKHWGGSIRELPQHYQKYKESNLSQTLYNKLRKAFADEHQWKVFKESEWTKGWESGEQWTRERLNELNELNREKTDLKEFSDVNDSATICHWAYHNPVTFDRYQVSVFYGLMRLNILRSKPFVAKMNDRCLPEPSDLFGDLHIVESDSHGFWVEMVGIQEYFSYCDHLFDDLSEYTARRNFLDKYNSDLAEELIRLAVEFKQMKNLKNSIDGLGDRKIEILNAYKHHDKKRQFERYALFEISQEEFDTCCGCYSELEMVTEAHDTARNVYKAIQTELQNCTNNLSRLSEQITDYDELFTPYIGTAKAVEQYIREHVNEFLQPIWTSPQTDSPFDVNYQIVRSSFRSGQSALLRKEEWEMLRQSYKDAQAHYQSVEKEYLAAHRIVPLLPIEQKLNTLDQCRNQYQEAKSDYESEYRQVVKHFLRDSAHELEGNYDYLILVHYLFPNLLDEQSTNEEAALALITQRLNEVLGFIRTLNKRRLNQINEVLGEVVEDWRELGRNLRRISRFFEDSKHHITGGHRVKLTPKDSAGFPIAWIHNFRRELATSPDFADQFINQVTFREKLTAAFKACSNVRNFEPDIRELLNPNSYQDLLFSIVTVDDNETVNDGSTGQTYAAIALLCIARLSLIGRGRRKGIRFMPIDEAEGLGSNYDMLYDIARNNDYQLISMSINLVGPFKEGDQYVHMLQRDLSSSVPVNYTPYSVFSEPDLDQLILNVDSKDEQWQDSDLDIMEGSDEEEQIKGDNIEEDTKDNQLSNGAHEENGEEESDEEPTA